MTSTRAAAGVAVRSGWDDDPVVTAMRGGDAPAFTVLVERHSRELQAHCRRMLRSAAEAEDVVQETFLRAWRRRASFEGRSTFRTWLYRIATNACLDELRRRGDRAGWRSAGGDDDGGDGDGAGRPTPLGQRRRTGAAGQAGNLGQLRQVRYVSRSNPSAGGGHATSGGLDGSSSVGPELVAPRDAEPEAAVVGRRSFETALLGPLHHLPHRQRAVLVLRDAFGWSAADTATLLDTTVAAANSALQRARTTLRTCTDT